MRKKLQKIDQQGDELVAIILDPPQVERLSQLRLQREGLRALDRPEFVKSLGLSDAQLEKLRKIRAPGPGSQPNENLSDEQRRAAREKLEAEVLAVITKEQQDNWMKMKGQAFRFPERLSQFDGRGLSPRGRGNDRGSRGAP